MPETYRPAQRARARSRAYGRFEQALVVVALACVVLKVGGYGSESVQGFLATYFFPAAAILFGLLDLLLFFHSRDREDYARRHAAELIVLALAALAAILAAVHLWPKPQASTVLDLLMLVAQYYVVAWVVIRVIRVFQLIVSASFRPAKLMIVSFAVIIVLGTLVLGSPHATAAGRRLPLIDALFTSTSATCVTGLIVLDTGRDFSRFGQSIILALIQLGGLGIMTFTTFFALVLGKGMGLRETRVMSDVLNAPPFGRVRRLVVTILVFTFSMELLGAIAFYKLTGTSDAAPFRGWWPSVFHSVSAFCNAGFSLDAGSFMRWRSSVPIVGVLAGLIIIGGLGFAVNQNLLTVGWARLFSRRPPAMIRRISNRTSVRLNLQTKLVLVSSLILILSGMAALLLLESSGLMKDMSSADRAMAAFFQSVTARTAGFNTVEINALGPTGKFILIILMFIGASPGSTGGGIKTVTFAVLLLSVVATARGDRDVSAFRRTVPHAIVAKALAVIVVSITFIALATVVLTATERGSGHAFIKILFEVFSAFGTVGLSTGITSSLSTVGKAVIVITMFVGRLGPLTMVLAMGERARRRAYSYPDENVMIG